MIISIRYHIFTITAIFAALGLGILIGSSIIGHEGMVEEQKKLIDTIGIEIRRLKNENLSLQERVSALNIQNTKREERIKNILPLVLKDELQDKNFYVFCEDKFKSSFKKELSSFFSKTGAKVSLVNNKYELKDDEIKSIDKVIFWNLNGGNDEVKDLVGANRFFSYSKSDILGMIFSLLEDEFSEKE